MFDLINGVPLHPLVVHAVVVLLPLGLLGTIAVALRPGWRRAYGPLVVGANLVATILCPVATSSGESLEQRVGAPGQHAALGDQLVWFAIALLITSAALVWLSRAPQPTPRQGRVLAVVAAASIVAALATGVQVYRVGDSGARAAWGDAATSGAAD